MPRASRIPAILQEARTHLDARLGPRLWNAKRRIKGSRGLDREQYTHFLEDPLSIRWRNQVSEDVREFVDKTKLLPEEKKQLFRSPSNYFSRPYNVPVELRKQVYLPIDTITLLRTPALPPKYASFNVPLHFNKLDMKSYLKEVYGVDIVHIRTTIIQAKVDRKRPANRYSRGALFRPQSMKKMIVQMESPFVWPAEVTDLTHWQKDEYWKYNEIAIETNRKDKEWRSTHVDENHRNSIAAQAKDLLAGKTKWKPTWQSIPVDVRTMERRATARP